MRSLSFSEPLYIHIRSHTPTNAHYALSFGGVVIYKWIIRYQFNKIIWVPNMQDGMKIKRAFKYTAWAWYFYRFVFTEMCLSHGYDFRRTKTRNARSVGTGIIFSTKKLVERPKYHGSLTLRCITICRLTHLPLVPYLCVVELGHQWFR